MPYDPQKHHRRSIRLKDTAPGSLGVIIQNYPLISTRRINKARRTPVGKVWQRNYYERIIRNERS
jgi:hypothetical protein